MTDPDSDRRGGEFRSDRRRGGWRDFRRSYPGFIFTMMIGVAALVAIDAWLIYKRYAYTSEVERLRSSMSAAERQRTDLIIDAEKDKLRMAVELARRQAQMDKRIHLSIPVDSGRIYLEREGAILREMPAQVGPERTVGTPPDTIRMATPRGERTIVEILTNGSWSVPAWVYADRKLPGSGGAVRGALGPIALVLDGGTVIYSSPASGPLADSTYVLPGSIRASEADLKAIVENLSAGTKVYFY
ncbi:MAG: L,D-transpeptidase [Gemmatimonadaceae bacterium]